MEYFTHLKDLGISGAIIGVILYLFLRSGSFLGPMIRTLFDAIISTLKVLQEHTARHTDLLALLVDANTWNVNELKEHRELLTKIEREVTNGSQVEQGIVAEDR